MYLLYYYIFLGFTDINEIIYNKRKYNSNIIIKDYSYNIYNIIYSNLIFILLLFSFIYDIIENNINIGYILYKLNYIFQYIILKKKFKKIIEYKFYESEIFYNFNLYLQIVIFILIIPHIYNYNLYKNNYNFFINIFINIIDVIGLLIYYNSLLIFILIFYKLYQELYIIKLDINDFIIDNDKGIIDIYYRLIHLKYKSSNYISNFNYIFNIFTIFNIISLVFISNDIDEINIKYITHFYFIVIFILFEIFILFLILLISKIRNDICDELFSETICHKFNKKYNISTFNDKYNIQLNIINNDINNILLENTNSLDWLILYNTLNIKWINFDLLGIEIQSFSSISRIILGTTIIYKLYY